MNPDRLEATNRLLNALERKLSLTSNTSSTYTTQSNGSVVQDPAYSGVARKNIQSSVLQYIKDDRAEFNADKLFSDRQQQFTTSFGREYSPSAANEGTGNNLNPDRVKLVTTCDGPRLDSRLTGSGSNIVEIHSVDAVDEVDEVNGEAHGEVNDEVNDEVNGEAHDTAYSDNSLESENDFDDDDYDYVYDDNDEDILLPPSPRLPPRDIDPSKLYGLFDFSGPDPSHCTLRRDEPVSLLNDSDDYWWLIRKMTKAERSALSTERGSHEELVSDEEDGKVGFVPGECLETYGERLARLNCYKNEVLEKCSGESLHSADIISSSSIYYEDSALINLGQEVQEPPKMLSVNDSSSILKKKPSIAHKTKSVTFENLGDVCFDDDDDAYSEDGFHFTNNYYSVGRADISDNILNDPEKQSEVLSEVYSVEQPLQIQKPRKNNTSRYANVSEFSKTPSYNEDNASIGSYSPDTPRSERFIEPSPNDNPDEYEGNLRRSIILDRLNIAISGIGQSSSLIVAQEPSFGNSISRHHHSDEDSDGSASETLFAEDTPRNKKSQDSVYGNKRTNDTSEWHKTSSESVNTPLTSANSLNGSLGSPKIPVSSAEKRKLRPTYNLFSPILGQLDELTERLAELEHSL